jgi:LacI family transcriptional regulator
MRAKLPRVALLIETSRTYGRGILRGIAHYAHVHGPWSFFTEERELHSGIPNRLRSWNVDGIIARIEGKRMAGLLARCGCPVVDVLGNARFKGVPGFDTEHLAVAKLAADFFLNAGFRHFAFCGYPGIPFSDRRADAFRNYLAVHRHTVSLPPVQGLFTSPAHIQATERGGLDREKTLAAWLRKQPRPLALFACNDICAQQVLNTCRGQDLKVPEEVAVMGVDNDDVLCNLCEPPLTSIEPDTERLGYEAAALLDQMMRGKKPKMEMTQIPPVRVVERASTDVVAIGDPITVQAVRFIRDHVDDGISAKDVLANVGRSRTDLEQRFRHWLKCSIRTEILRLRMNRVKNLLQQTDLTLDEIAARAGLATAAHLCRLFRLQFRATPTQYRNRLLK